MARGDKRRIGVFNWLGTLVLYAIPGVNIIFLILTVIFAKAQSKRTFAIAALILMAVLALAAWLTCMFLPDWVLSVAEEIRSLVPAATPLP